MYGIALIIVLVITGGAIAFIGDHLGSKVGKKRISLFGLRPKHTSILVTIITGVLITSSTIGIMAIASDNVRTALFGMEKLNQEMADTKERLLTASRDLEQSRIEQQSADIALNHAKEGLKELQDQMGDLRDRNNQLQEGNMTLEQAKEELMEKYGILSAANDDLLLSQAELRQGNDRLSGENKDLEARNKDLRDGIMNMREGEIVFRAGEVITSGVLQGKLSEDEVKEELQKLLAFTQERAYVALTQRSGREITTDDVQVWVYPPEYDAAVEYIMAADFDVLVRVSAVSNLLKGEGIRVSLGMYQNKLAFADGVEVFQKELTLDGTSKKAEEEVVQFLNDVNDAAIKGGMLPDPITGSIGVIDGNQVFNAIKQLETIRGKAVLIAYANGNTNIQGPLRITLHVRQ